MGKGRGRSPAAPREGRRKKKKDDAIRSRDRPLHHCISFGPSARFIIWEKKKARKNVKRGRQEIAYEKCLLQFLWKGGQIIDRQIKSSLCGKGIPQKKQGSSETGGKGKAKRTALRGPAHMIKKDDALLLSTGTPQSRSKKRHGEKEEKGNWNKSRKADMQSEHETIYGTCRLPITRGQKRKCMGGREEEP